MNKFIRYSRDFFRGIIFLTIIFIMVASKADAIIVNSFYDLIDWSGGSQTVETFVNWDTGEADNLMIRDPVTGVDSIVEKDGSVWRMGFAKTTPTTIQYGAYANNYNYLSNTFPLVAGGHLLGARSRNTFADGERPDEVLLVHDQLGDGMGEVIGTTWHLGADDVPYWSKDIEFSGVQGDLTALALFPSSGDYILPHMVVNPVVPEPGTLLLLGSGLIGLMTLRKKRRR